MNDCDGYAKLFWLYLVIYSLRHPLRGQEVTHIVIPAMRLIMIKLQFRICYSKLLKPERLIILMQPCSSSVSNSFLQ